MSAPVTHPAPPAKAIRPSVTSGQRQPLPDDGTRQLLLGGLWTLITGIAAALATRFVFGGMSAHGPHTNGGWLSLIVAMMCLPFSTMLLLLGGAKYLRNRRLTRR